jgi:two-component system sensor histidine kinase CiaH
MAARLDGTKEAITSAEVALSDLVRREVQRFEKLYGVLIEGNIVKEIRMKGDEQMLSILISNLLDNALKYGAGKPVQVELSQVGEQVVFAISDRGGGIPVGEEKRIFEKFYRIGNEETRTSKGTGLGLFIVDAVARMHDAEVSAASRQGGGAVFTVKFRKQ